MKNNLLIMAALAGVLFLQSCGGGKEGVLYTGIGLNNYPLATGDQWLYQISDSLGHVIDTTTFTITGIAASNSDSTVYKTSTAVGSTVTDSGTILVVADSLTYRPTGTQSLFGYLKFAFPITINGSWQGYYSGDSLHVVAYGIQFTELANSYGNASQLSRYYLTPAYAVQATLYVVPNVGIVQENIETSTQQVNSVKTVKLISYTL
jgi:hypothetical protein